MIASISFHFWICLASLTCHQVCREIKTFLLVSCPPFRLYKCYPADMCLGMHALRLCWFCHLRHGLIILLSFLLRVESCCWISTLQYGSDGEIFWGTNVSLVRRSDTGRLNFSPRSAQLPIISVQERCNTTIPIHTDDPDGDRVECRWASGVECGGACSAFPGATLTAVSSQRDAPALYATHCIPKTR